MSIPHIDLNKDPKTLEPGTREWELTSRIIRESLEMYGCFMVDYHVISGDEQEEMFSAMESFFALPVETRRNIERFPRSKLFCRGDILKWSPMESVGIVDDQITLEKFQAFTNLLWPEGNDKFCQTMTTRTKKMRDLAHILMKMIFHSFGLERDCESHLDATEIGFSMLRYSAPMTDEPMVGAAEHVDGGFLTILCQNEVNGLSIKTRKGDWLQVIPEKNTFLVQTGLTFRAWSNGRLHVPPHMVTLTGHKVRLTNAFFLFRKLDQIVETPAELADKEHPLLFEPFRFGEFYDFLRARSFAEDSLDVFAGIKI